MIPDSSGSWQRDGDQPLTCVILTKLDNARCPMPRRDPFETLPFMIEINAGGARVPFYESVSELERESTANVSPRQGDVTSCGEFVHNVGNRLVPGRRQVGEMACVEQAQRYLGFPILPGGLRTPVS